MLCGARAAFWLGDFIQETRTARPDPPIHSRDRPGAIVEHAAAALLFVARRRALYRQHDLPSCRAGEDRLARRVEYIELSGNFRVPENELLVMNLRHSMALAILADFYIGGM